MRSPFSRRIPVTLVAIAALAVTVRAAEPPSLPSVPADVAFYSSSLRLGEQIDRFVKSKAFATLHDLPAVKAFFHHLHTEIDKGDNPLSGIAKAMHDPANRELVELCHDAFRHEIFVYGGKNWAEFAKLAIELQGATRFAPALAALQGQNPQTSQLHALVRALNLAGDKLQIPETVIGFRITKAEAATNQIKRLEDLLQKATEETPLKGRIKRAQVAGVDALTLTLDGSMVPWNQFPLDDLDEESAAEIKALFGKLKTLKLSASLLVKDNVVMLTFGPTTGAADSFGRGPSLATRSELKPLAKHAEKPLISVGYVSAALAAAVATTAEDIDSLAQTVTTALAKTPISEEERTAIGKDVKQLAKEVASTIGKPAGTFSCTFLTARGQETYSYDYGPAPTGAAKPLSVVEHLGGSPLVAFAGSSDDPSPGYKFLVKWLRVVYGHADTVVKETLGEEQQKHLHDGMAIVRPLLERFDSITSTQLLPALGNGEFAVVIDAKWSSKNWFPGVDQGDTALPFFELGFVRTVNDSAPVLKALQAYRALANDALAKAREFGAPLPEAGIPPAETKSIGSNTAYYWPIPAYGQDEQIQPNLGMSAKTIVKSLSFRHTERLLTPAPLATLGGLLEPDRPLLAAAVVDVEGLIKTGRPWLEKFAIPAMLADAPDDAPPGLTRKELPDQIRKVLDVMQCLRGVRSVTYRDGDATVTHSELIVEDLK
jgi:hypothetical protein